MKISIIGTGYVGLVTGVSFAEIGNEVTCIDVDDDKINKLQQGISPIYEPGIEELITKNINNKNLRFTNDIYTGLKDSKVIFIAVGTPPREDGSVDLQYIVNAAKQIANSISSYTIIVTKSTVPVGTNERIMNIVKENLVNNCDFDVVSNPEFLREGSAIYDTFNGERIIIGAENKNAANIIGELYKPFNIPIIYTDLRSSEMIKYTANAFLATKISFINEIANICEKINANVDDVAIGIGLDSRIGQKFLKSGIGFGGSCFPKDTNGLYQIAKEVGYNFNILKSVISVNEYQMTRLVDKAINYFGNLENKKIAVLGLAFKPNTDDMREAPSIKIINSLRRHNCNIYAYDPIAIPNARSILGEEKITYCKLYKDALKNADFALILTEWDEFINMDLNEIKELMGQPVIFDGRNCFSLKEMEEKGYVYFSIGRPAVK